ncbi:hypothetical protein TNIN_428351 [Trichonephila inaurata madagascariensis]|uniref:Uncharacterized protein n=1 Tax=Trichonephila inaurata madagascariensis TaxID=2747483 RepID=A0A8X7CRA2_9ARAC|nr:hypothetical protein TNIN_428351 [Trichonephila inaurata madagascariensis]
MTLPVLAKDLCQDLLPAPGNKTNDIQQIWQRGPTIQRGGPDNDWGRPDRTKGESRVVARKPKARKRWLEEERRLDDGLQSYIILMFFMRCPIEGVK